MQENLLKVLAGRRLATGGYCEYPDGNYRPDSTAWAILALCALGAKESVVASARSRLRHDQFADGRISISSEHPDAIWPTSVALLAWLGSPADVDARFLAARFLLSSSGTHGLKEADSPLGHDTSLRGWSWVEKTHSWIEPTALAVIALRAAGFDNHPRIHEAIRMLIDRQLPSGGWNYGNTIVFGQELQPMADSTGLALQSLAGLSHKEDLANSLAYLETSAIGLRTPFSLGWGLLGLAAWGVRLPSTDRLIFQCLERQSHLGAYQTTNLCLLALALMSPSGLLNRLQEKTL